MINLSKFVVFSSFLLWTACLSKTNSAYTQSAQVAAIGFYNLENLFDTEDDPAILDEEFTPGGPKLWTEDKYRDKLQRLSSVISDFGKDFTADGVAILGVCEIENKRVLEDLVQSEKLKNKNYQIIHFNSKDPRGIDVALLYQSKYFTPIESKSITLNFLESDNSIRRSRDLLFVKGMLGDQLIFVTVNHWPSRRGGQQLTDPYRIQAAKFSKHLADSVLAIHPDAHFIVMGDLNDNPNNVSMVKGLQAKQHKDKLKKNEFYNPYYNNFIRGDGTTAYQDSWSLFDQIIFSENLLKAQKKKYYFYKHTIYKKDYMIEMEGHFKNYPKRTFSGDIYNFGYSDHFPVLIYLVREI
ncbi:MAG: hypothetical protein M3Q56_09600 [Bacteroidota bacterium]|nr:hypothetical protein [Bacteroidota bacterium]